MPTRKTRSEAPPFRRIILPVDFSTCAERALPRALAIAERAGAEVFLLHVLQPHQVHETVDEGGTEDFDIWREERARARLQNLRMSYRYGLSTRREVILHPIVTVQDDAAEGIVRYAGRIKADLIVMGTHGWTVSYGPRLGSVAHRVIEQAPCPVMTVPVHRQVIGEVRRVMIAADDRFSPSPATLLADRLAQFFGNGVPVNVTAVSSTLTPHMDVEDADLLVAPTTAAALRYVQHGACAVLAPAASLPPPTCSPDAQALVLNKHA